MKFSDFSVFVSSHEPNFIKDALKFPSLGRCETARCLFFRDFLNRRSEKEEAEEERGVRS